LSGSHRVAVTGIGVVTPLGIGKDIFWRNVLAERVAVDLVRNFDTTGYRSKLAAQIVDFEPRDFMSDKRQRWTDRFSQFAVAAARLALEDAGFNVNGASSEIGVYLGSALGGLAFADEQHDAFRA
jgi:3-oxoacyl-[acyl-carrier-protein] synthase II